MIPPRLRHPAVPLVVLALLVAIACTGDEAERDGVDLARGEQLFDNNCAVCHGPAGTGTVDGPPLVHEIYEPGHHPDETFVRAVQEGVPQHHWDHGPMPAVPGLSEPEIEDIIAYIRELQREAGIID